MYIHRQTVQIDSSTVAAKTPLLIGTDTPNASTAVISASTPRLFQQGPAQWRGRDAM
jgi:hypothetical protein